MDPTLARLLVPPSSGGLAQTGTRSTNSYRKHIAKRQHWYRAAVAKSSQNLFQRCDHSLDARIKSRRWQLLADAGAGDIKSLRRIKIALMPECGIGQRTRLPLLHRRQRRSNHAAIH